MAVSRSLQWPRDRAWVAWTLTSAALVSLIVGLGLLFFWGLPVWTADEQTSPNDIRETWAPVFAGAVLLAVATVTAYLTLRRVAATERSAEAAVRNVQIAEQGQITERFTRAVDQLGATTSDGRPRLEVRLGGIYALERISRESGADFWPIMDLLAAYVRIYSPVPKEGDEFERPTATRSDLAAIAQVMRKASRPAIDRDEGLDLSDVNLHGFRLSGVDLQAANLSRANLGHAGLEHANLENSLLHEASLEGAILTEANLDGAILTDADLGTAECTRATFNNANLTGANLQLAVLTGASLRQALLANADLRDAVLLGADLRGATLSDGTLYGALLRNSDLRGATLDGAKFGQHTYGFAHLGGALIDRRWQELLLAEGVLEYEDIVWV